LIRLRCYPSGGARLTATPSGLLPTVIVAVTALLAVAITDTLSEPAFVT
jgi:hypothetical protein